MTRKPFNSTAVSLRRRSFVYHGLRQQAEASQSPGLGAASALQVTRAALQESGAQPIRARGPVKGQRG
jgi:hypothetical protein